MCKVFHLKKYNEAHLTKADHFALHTLGQICVTGTLRNISRLLTIQMFSAWVGGYYPHLLN